MKVKNEIFDPGNGTWNALIELGGEKLPFKLGYDVSRIIRKMREGQEVYEEARGKIVKELGEETGDGGYRIDPKDKEAMKKFMEEMKKINEEENEYDVTKLVIHSKEMGETNVKPNTLVLLEDFIEVK